MGSNKSERDEQDLVLLLGSPGFFKFDSAFGI